MEYRVDELARAAGVRVDTVRFYQAKGLIPPPERRGRVAIYSEHHLARLRQVRELNRQGISLDAIRRLGDPTEPTPGATGDEAESSSATLLAALDALEGDASYSQAELAAQTGFPPFLLDSLAELGLLEPVDSDSGSRYTEADRGALEAARSVLEAGVPLAELLPLARTHARHVEEVADRAVSLFEQHVRRRDAETPPDARGVARAFRELLPVATTLVALHFQRVLLRRTRARLRAGSDPDLARAIDSSPRGRLRVSWQ